MPKDKFAAMASRANKPIASASEPSPAQQQQEDQQQQPQQQRDVPPTVTAPKRDKMAALASRQQKAGAVASTTTASPPKRDKMAALAARSNTSPVKTDSSDEPHKPTTTPPKRDKMAALAARSNASPLESNKNNAEVAQTNPQRQQTDGNSASPPSETPRRNKLAALASRSMNNPPSATSSHPAAPPRNNKLAKLVGASQSQPAGANSSTTEKVKSEGEVAAEAAIAREKHLSKLKERLSKRKGILDSLDRAEELTCRLLKIAAKTTDALQDLNFSPHLSKLSVTYRATLQELHPLLTMGTEELIKPYQNHTKETKQSMYAARVEMRLAKERLEVLKTFSALEKEVRERQDEADISGTTTENVNPAMASDESDRKRKR